jgi:hypothetical protein
VNYPFAIKALEELKALIYNKCEGNGEQPTILDIGDQKDTFSCGYRIILALQLMII